MSAACDGMGMAMGGQQEIQDHKHRHCGGPTAFHNGSWAHGAYVVTYENRPCCEPCFTEKLKSD